MTTTYYTETATWHERGGAMQAIHYRESGVEYVAMRWGGWVSRFIGSDPKYRCDTDFAPKQKTRNGVKGPFAKVTQPGWYELATEGKAGPRRYEYFDGTAWHGAPNFREVARTLNLTDDQVDRLAEWEVIIDLCALCDTELVGISPQGVAYCDDHADTLNPPTNEPPTDKEAPF